MAAVLPSVIVLRKHQIAARLFVRPRPFRAASMMSGQSCVAKRAIEMQTKRSLHGERRTAA
jgi:hypothetical protein